MASRLSEESLTAVLDAGQQGLPLQGGAALGLIAPKVDLDQLLLTEDPEAAVQAVLPHAMYQALVLKGPEDCLDILPHLSQDQVQRIFDYDAWRSDRLEPLKAIRWLDLFKEVSNEELYRRFRELDEEYQLALIGPLVDLIDEDEFEKLSDEAQDAMNKLPCSTLYYRIKTEDPRIEAFVMGLVEATLQSDVAYAYSLLAHSAYMPPNEQEAQIGQFRRARLEEDGFLSYSESLAAFQPVDVEQLKKTWRFKLHVDFAGEAAPQHLPITQAKSAGGDPFLRQALASDLSPDVASNVSMGLAFLANSLCASAQIEPDDLAALRLLMSHAQAMVSLGLEVLADGDVKVGRAIIAEEHPQMLFRVGLMVLRRLAASMLTRLEFHGAPGADRLADLLRRDRRGQLGMELESSLLEILGFERTQMLKGLCNRFPLRISGVLSEHDHEGAAPGAPRLGFKPVATVADLVALAAEADALSGLLHLASLASDRADDQELPLDVRLTTALARALKGEEFRFAPLSPAELAQLEEMPPEAVRAVAGDLCAGVEGSLRVALTPTIGNPGWCVSQAAGIKVEDPVHAVMVEFSDLIMRLATARASGLNGAVRGLVAHTSKDEKGN